MEPKVSIGMPVYNSERYLEETLDSILAQTFRDFELIISDNGSTDRTDEICRRYAAADSRIRYDRNSKNMGASYNYNKVFRLARGAYFKHAAYDDLLGPTYLERLVEVLDREPAVVLAYPRCQIIDDAGQPNLTAPPVMELRSREKSAHERFRRYIPRSSSQTMCDPIFGLYRTETFGRTRLIQSYPAQDAILLGEITLLGQIEEVPEVLFFERWHKGGSIMSNQKIHDLYAWYDPNMRGRLPNILVHWRWVFELAQAIGRAPISRSEKLKCYFTLRLYALRNAGGMLSDLYWASRYLARVALGNIFNRVSGPPRPSSSEI